MPPRQRLAFAAQNGMPPQVLMQMEAIAQSMGIPLEGGSLNDAGGDEDDDGEGGAGGEDGDGGDEAAPVFSLADVAAEAYDKVLRWGAPLAFYAAVPAVLFVITSRRGMSWRDLAATVLRLPFD